MATGSILDPLHGFNISLATELRVEGVGRPDVALGVDCLNCGYVELKAGNTVANAKKFKGRKRSNSRNSLPSRTSYTDSEE